MAPPNGLLAVVILQGNTIRGYRYLDDCGKIINRFLDDFPDRQWGLQGLELKNPDAKFRAITVTNERIATTFEEPDSLAYSIDNGFNAIEEIAGIIDVQQLNRIAIRIQVVFESNDLSETARQIEGSVLAPRMNALIDEFGHSSDHSFDFLIRLKPEQMIVNLRVDGVRRAEGAPPSSALPAVGTLIDTDIYRQGEFSLLEFRRFLRLASTWHARIMPTRIYPLIFGV